jgi:hypothetical protein
MRESRLGIVPPFDLSFIDHHGGGLLLSAVGPHALLDRATGMSPTPTVLIRFRIVRLLQYNKPRLLSLVKSAHRRATILNGGEESGKTPQLRELVLSRTSQFEDGNSSKARLDFRVIRPRKIPVDIPSLV